MSRTEILTQIKGAEKAADEKVEAARIKSRDDISNARRNAVKKIQNEEAKIRASVDSAIAAKNKELADNRDEFLKQGQVEADKLETSSAAKMKNVKDFLYKEFERPLDVTS